MLVNAMVDRQHCRRFAHSIATSKRIGDGDGTSRASSVGKRQRLATAVGRTTPRNRYRWARPVSRPSTLRVSV